jgi:hypothetical protein
MRAEQRERDGGEPVIGSRQRASRSPKNDGESAGPLPALDGVIEQIPADVRATLDELFRARFVRVQRIQESALK